MVSLYLRYATGIRIWWIFSKWAYSPELLLHVAIAWGMAIPLGILVFLTYRTIKIYVVSKNRN
jgi:hypothetical protein